MADPPTQPPAGRTNWRRFAIVLAPSLVAASFMTVMMGTGALAASFTISGQQAKISADSLDGTGFVQYGWIDQTARKDAIPVAVSGIKHAELVNMCQSVVFTLPIVGDVTLKINAGKASPVIAEDIMIDMSQLDGDATFTTMEIGNDASTLSKGPAKAKGFQDMFGQQADKIHIDNLRQVTYATSAGSFKLTGLHLTVNKGRDECYVTEGAS
jgi:hypothetical protein